VLLNALVKTGTRLARAWIVLVVLTACLPRLSLGQAPGQVGAPPPPSEPALAALKELREVAPKDDRRRLELAQKVLECLEGVSWPEAEVEARFLAGRASFGLAELREAREHLSMAAGVAREAGEEAWLQRCLLSLAIAENALGDFDAAIESCEEARALAIKLERPGRLCRIENVLGTVFERKGEFQRALEVYAGALATARELQDQPAMSMLLNNIGVAHMSLEQPGEAIRFFSDVADVHRAAGSGEGYAGALSNLGDAYLALEETEHALELQLAALEVRSQVCTEDVVSLSHLSVGRVYLRLGEYELASEHLQTAREVQERLGMRVEAVATLSALSSLYADLDAGGEAVQIATEGLRLANSLELRGHRVDALQALAKAHEAAGDPEAALAVLRQATALERELRSSDSRRAFDAFRAELETERGLDALRGENELQELELEHQRLWRASLTVGVLLCLVALFFAVSRLRMKRSANKLLSERKQHYHALCDLSPAGIFQTDAEGVCRYVSRRWHEITGTPTTSPARSWFGPVNAEDKERLVAAWEELRAGAERLELEYRLERPDGSTTQVFVQVVPEARADVGDLGASASGFVGTLTDVSEPRRLEQRVLQSQKLSSLGLLAGGIAHDFNNLLASILGNASIARDGLSADAPQAPPLEAIEHAAQRAAELCRQLLAYAGKGRFEITRIDLNRLVREMCGLLEFSLPDGARLDLRLNELSEIKGDATQMRQVIVNLLSNAIEALEGGSGSVVVRSGTCVELEADWTRSFLAEGPPPPEYAWLEIADDGCGLDAAAWERMFDPFFTTKATGHGLGMSAVLGVVRAHCGAIRVSSAQGTGTKIRVALPASGVRIPDAKPPLPSRERPAPKSAAFAGQEPAARDLIAHNMEGAVGKARLVLVVDDDEAVRDVCAQALCRAGFEVLTAQDGAQGLALFEEHRGSVEAVVLDSTMPVLDGQATLVRLRALSGELPVVMISGFIEEAGPVRPSAFLRKPFRPKELVQNVARVIDRPRAVGKPLTGAG
jgi:PAS domain S-box-containing protein